MRALLLGALTSAVAFIGFASTAGASSTIDLIWGTGTPTTSSVATSSLVTLSVIITAGPNGSQGAAVTVDYSAAAGYLSVVGISNNPDGGAAGALLPLALGTTTDSGTMVNNVNAASIPPPGLLFGQTWLLGVITFHKSAGSGTFAIVSTTTGTDDILDLIGNVTTGTSTFNGALISSVPEPATFAMLGVGLGGLAFVGRRRPS